MIINDCESSSEQCHTCLGSEKILEAPDWAADKKEK